ncbi:hypothetical protein [Kribbella antiqua]|uniref:hypothetical protein n=1 Tax=Kribbella antiqua TaxID=2512217 RepID=UPI00130516F3|nr:hypothetical protein [Kribbella antiqua]
MNSIEHPDTRRDIQSEQQGGQSGAEVRIQIEQAVRAGLLHSILNQTIQNRCNISSFPQPLGSLLPRIQLFREPCHLVDLCLSFGGGGLGRRRGVGCKGGDILRNRRTAGRNDPARNVQRLS